ncbi:hypothetical protein Ocin01_15752 [Orchesella cincta]|uniref:Chitin-binding type-4 domain-containing protein n=1 Tax=Orchesella cincta TaxID=48709 RepID=A0A1D2MDH1_ORCCI|nr:hypothetical protein Ocin01_15752 [Orchesella cincta]
MNLCCCDFLRSKMKTSPYQAIFITFAILSLVWGHGRLIVPPSRSSVWRLNQFVSQNPPINLNDNELHCDGVLQADEPGSNCGVCGDSILQNIPRDNEINGNFYRGIITDSYSAGQIIEVQTDITATHRGHMEWRLCTDPKNETQACFNQHVLHLATGFGGTKVPVSKAGRYRTKLLLPEAVQCDHCIIQWNYRGGNKRGMCENGMRKLGCGPQNTFRGCSDVSILLSIHK